MGKTVRSWQKRAGWQVSRHKAAKRQRLSERDDKFRFDSRTDYRSDSWTDYRSDG